MINKKNIVDFLLYVVVGACATLAEWLIFCLLDKCALHYALATVIAYILSTFVNWLVGRLLVFKERKQSILKEILSIYLASIIGLLLNLLIMWVTVDLLSVPNMIAKILATGLVFFYNFIIRKLCIYK
jgi:putative flippase GtrA